MILVNLSHSSLDADKHSVPTVHVNPPATEAIKAKVAANPALTVSLVNKDTTGTAARGAAADRRLLLPRSAPRHRSRTC